MEAAVRDPLAKLRVTVGLHNGSHETWLQYDAVIDEYAREGAAKLAELRREVENGGDVALPAAQAIGRMGVEGWPTLKALLSHPSDAVRQSAILGGVVELWCGWRWDEATIEECTKILSVLLQTDTPENRSAIVRSIWEVVDLAIARPLFPALMDLADKEDQLGKEARTTLANVLNPNHLEDLADDPSQAALLRSAYERARARESGAETGGKR